MGYRVIRPLGRGGMGEVYEVEHIELGRRVALKVMRPEIVSRPGFAERFRQEGHVLARLSHPGIVTVHDMGSDEGRLFIAMEFIEGPDEKPLSLADELAEKGKLPENEVRRLALEVCEALGAAHEKGVLHRDLKPGNVLLDPDRRARLTDFGLAKVVGHEEPMQSFASGVDISEAGTDVAAPMTVPGAVTGTPEYMSPEQAAGEELDERSDIYSLGVMIYRMLTGQRSVGLFEMPSELGLSPGWDSTLRNCLAQAPGSRADSVRSLARSLRDVDIGARGPRALPDERARQRVSVESGSSPRGKKTKEEKGARAFRPGVRVNSVAFSPDGSYLATATGDGNVILWEARTGSKARTFKGYERGIDSIAFSPDGERLAASHGRAAVLWEVPSGKEIKLFEGHRLPVTAVAYSLDGRYLATAGHDRTAVVWDVRTGTELRKFKGWRQGHRGRILCVAFSPNGQYLGTGSRDGTARLWDMSTGRVKWKKRVAWRIVEFDVWSLAFSPDGRYLAAAFSPYIAHEYYESRVVLLEPESGKEVWSTEMPLTKCIWSLAFSPDSRLLATGGSDNRAIVWGTNTANSLARYNEHEEAVWSVAFSSDGRYLATGSADGTARIWPLPEKLWPKTRKA